MNIKEKVRNFMANEFKKFDSLKDASDDTSLITSGILDSLSILKLISFMDDEFNVMPGEDELDPDKFETINLITAFIESKKALK